MSTSTLPPKVVWALYDLCTAARVKGFNPTNCFEFGASTGRSFSPIPCFIPGNPDLKIVGVSFSFQRKGESRIAAFEIRCNQGAVFHIILGPQTEKGVAKELLDKINNHDISFDYLKNLEDLTHKSWKLIGQDLLGNNQWKAI